VTRFLHTADLHLNAQRRNFPHYLQRAEWLLRELEDLAAEQKCDCIVVAGDVFDQPNATIAERQVLSDWLGRLQTPVLMISGNHDARSKTIGDTCLSYLSSLKLHLHLVHDGDPRTVNAFGCYWLLLPYHPWTDQEFRLIVRAMVEKIRHKHADVPIVAVMHDAVRGAMTERNIAVKKSDQITLIPELGPTYWALGDIHAPQQMLPNAFYCGAPYQVDFGELAEHKGVLLVDTDDPEHPVSVDLDCPYPLVTLDEAPNEWPAFGRYRGEWTQRLPSHILYQPAAAGPRPEIEIQRSRVPLFFRLREKLVEQHHPEDLLDPTVEMAHQLAQELGLEI